MTGHFSEEYPVLAFRAHQHDGAMSLPEFLPYSHDRPGAERIEAPDGGEV